MASVFISYRHADSKFKARLLASELKNELQAHTVFRDDEVLEPGADYIEALQKAAGTCDVMLAVIGPNWVGGDTPPRRIDDPDDWVAAEVATALEREVRVVPLLVDDARMPDAGLLPERLKPLTRLHALELSDRYWPQDVNVVATTVEELLDRTTSGGTQDVVKGQRSKQIRKRESEGAIKQPPAPRQEQRPPAPQVTQVPQPPPRPPQPPPQPQWQPQPPQQQWAQQPGWQQPQPPPQQQHWQPPPQQQQPWPQQGPTKPTGALTGWGWAMAIGSLLIPLLAIVAIILGVQANKRWKATGKTPGTPIIVTASILGALAFVIYASAAAGG